MDEPFKLSSDDTMRHLRRIAQSPGELNWRLELLAGLERWRMETEVSTRSILQAVGQLQKQMSHLTPTKLAETINVQVDEKLKPTARDANRIGKAVLWILDKTAAVGIGLMIAYYSMKH